MNASSNALLKVWWRLARTTVAVFCRTWWRAEVRGHENVPSEGPFVISPVHRSNVDTLLCGLVTRRQMRFMAKDSLWKYRWSGALMGSLGGFPVNRLAPDREALRTAEEALRRGDPVVVFPEGTRQSGDRVHRLFEGAAFLAARTGAPIVPVGIGGSEWAMPKGSRFLHPVKVVMVVGKPLAAPPRTEGGRVPRRVVAELTDELHGQLQTLFDEALAAAGRA